MVYVVQETPDKNILPATKWGELRVMLAPGNIGFSAGHITHQLHRELQNFNDDDYLLLIGDPVAIGLAVAVAMNYNQGKAKLLKWDKQERVYYPLEVNLYQKGERDDTSQAQTQ